MEIRLHGRGGQGGVTGAKLIAATFARLGKHVQTFGDYAGERSGAPIRAYARVADSPIESRNKVYRPDHVVVLDAALLSPETVAGLAPGGWLLVNTPEPPQALAPRFPTFRVATVDATAIARRHDIGTRSVVIVNTTIAGAFARMLDLPLTALEGAYADLGLLRDFVSAREAHAEVRLGPAGPRTAVPEPSSRPASAGTAAVVSLLEHREGLPTGVHTGSWRTQTPRYVTRAAPCSASCPAGNDVIGFVRAVASSGAAAAAEILGRTTPLATVCGRVCPAPCMQACNRGAFDGAVNVRGLERWVASQEPVATKKRRRSAALASGLRLSAGEGGFVASRQRRIAIVGGGPAGLSAAYELARSGHAPTIFDAEQKLGGVLHTGIPTYRLPRAPLEREIADVVALGVELRLGQALSGKEIAGLLRRYDAVILALGLQRPRELAVPGRRLAGVEQGLAFLRRVNVDGDARLTGRVVVLGGGNTAIDCARSALRAGAAAVTVAYRRSRAELPAIPEEVAEAEAEGVAFAFLKAPVGFSGVGRVDGVELEEMELGPADASGRQAPVPTGRRRTIACDAVLMALGQSADETVLPQGWSLREGHAWSDDGPLPVFAAGDLATGDGTVAHAIGDGRRVALRALAALGEAVPAEPRLRPDRAVPPSAMRFHHFPGKRAAREASRPGPDAIRSFDEVQLGLPDGAEAGRCLSCGHCTSCDTCLVYCPEAVIARLGSGYTVDLDYCKGCGVCAAECPRGGIEMGAI
jgi:2-oxoacid:acceptor oxidoreductase gamma subunit (pyruvate/2-ketoisovalerate family)